MRGCVVGFAGVPIALALIALLAAGVAGQTGFSIFFGSVPSSPLVGDHIEIRAVGSIASFNTKLADLDITYSAELVNDGPMAITAAPAGSSQSMSCVQSREDFPPTCTFVWILPLGDLAVVNSTIKANVTFYESGSVVWGPYHQFNTPVTYAAPVASCAGGCNFTQNGGTPLPTDASGNLVVAPLSDLEYVCYCEDDPAYANNRPAFSLPTYYLRYAPAASCLSAKGPFFRDGDKGLVSSAFAQDALSYGKVAAPPRGFYGCSRWDVFVYYYNSKTRNGIAPDGPGIKVATFSVASGADPYGTSTAGFASYLTALNGTYYTTGWWQIEYTSAVSTVRLAAADLVHAPSWDGQNALGETRKLGVHTLAAAVFGSGVATYLSSEAFFTIDTDYADQAYRVVVAEAMASFKVIAGDVSDADLRAGQAVLWKITEPMSATEDQRDLQFRFVAVPWRAAAALAIADMSVALDALALTGAYDRCSGMGNTPGPYDIRSLTSQLGYDASSAVCPGANACSDGGRVFAADANGVVFIPGTGVIFSYVLNCGTAVERVIIGDGEFAIGVPAPIRNAYASLTNDAVYLGAPCFRMRVGAGSPRPECGFGFGDALPSEFVGYARNTEIELVVVDGSASEIDISSVALDENDPERSFRISMGLLGEDGFPSPSHLVAGVDRICAWQEPPGHQLFLSGCVYNEYQDAAAGGAWAAECQCNHLTFFTFIDVVGDDDTPLISTVINAVLGTAFGLGLAVVVQEESFRATTQVASLTEAGSFLANLLIFRIQVLQTLGLVGDSPKVLRDLTKGISFVNFILPPFLFGNNDFDDSVAIHGTSRRLLQSNDTVDANVTEVGALVGIEKYAQVLDINVDHMMLMVLLLVCLVLLVVIGVVAIVANACRRRYVLAGTINAHLPGIALRILLIAYLGLTMTSSFTLTFADTLQGAALAAFLIAIVVYTGYVVVFPAFMWWKVHVVGSRRQTAAQAAAAAAAAVAAGKPAPPASKGGLLPKLRQTEKFSERWGPVYSDYSWHAFGFVFLLKKFAMGSVLGFLSASSGVQLVLLMLTQLAYLVSLVVIRPHLVFGFTVMEAILAVVDVITFGLMLPYSDLFEHPTPANERVAPAWISLVVQLTGILTLLSMICYRLYLTIKECECCGRGGDAAAGKTLAAKGGQPSSSASTSSSSSDDAYAPSSSEAGLLTVASPDVQATADVEASPAAAPSGGDGSSSSQGADDAYPEGSSSTTGSVSTGTGSSSSS